MLRRSFIFLWAALGFSQVYTPGPQVLTFLSDVDDSDQPYALYLPASFDPARKYPLVISLHGATSNHRLNLRRVFGRGNRPLETDSEASRYFPHLRSVNFIVACPFARGTMGYQGIPEKDVYDVLADVKRRFPIDEDRVYLTGLSMGGGGTLWLGLTRPDLWAAIAPVCAAAPPDTEDLAPNALDLPVHLFQGDADPVVPVERAREWQKRLLELGTDVEYVEYPGVRHNSWDHAYRNGAIFDWFSRFRRNPFPKRVRFVSRAYKYSSAYWMQLDALTPGTLASIDARFTGPNQLEVTTGNLDGFTLKLAGHPQFSSKSPVAFRINGSLIRRKVAGGSLSFLTTEKGWKVGRYKLGVGDKQTGAEGPISEVVAARHIYVYGTADGAGPDELKRRRAIALRASNWSTWMNRLQLTFTVKADKDVTPQDLEESNLVLFGTKETNRLIARFADRFPVALNAGAADYGLVFVFPAGKHYVLVNSGLPWWTGADEVKRGGLSFLPPAVRLLLSFQDYILFKGSLEHVVTEGRFDRQWKLPETDAAKMRATGAVVLQ